MADTSSAHGYGAILIQKETTFGTDPGSWVDATHYIEVRKFTDNRSQNYHENDAMKQGLQQHTSGIIGVKSDSTIELEMWLHGYDAGTVSDAPVLATDRHPDALLVSAALGGCIAGGYDGTGITGGTVDAPELTATASMAVGQALLFDSGINGQVGWVKTVTSGTELALEHSLDFVPATGAKVYGSLTCYPTDAYDATMSPSLAFKKLGLRADDVVLYKGCRPNSLKISGSPKDFLTMTVGLNVTDWDREDTGGDPDPLTYAYPDRELIVGARLLLQDNASPYAMVEADCSKFDVDFGIAIAPKLDLNAYEGVSEYYKTAIKVVMTLDPIQGIESTSAGWEYAFENQTSFTAMLQIGTTAGRTISICMPACELVELPATSDVNGLNAKSLKLMAMAHSRDTGTGADSNAINKVVKVAFL